MFALAIGRKAAAPARTNRPANRREAETFPAAPLSTETDAPVATVTDVEVALPVRKRYRGVVVRNRTERAVVEFEADETADLYAVAEALLPQIPADAWTPDPSNDYGYIDRIDEVEAELVDVEEIGEPVEPSQTLSRRLRALRASLIRQRLAQRARKMDGTTEIDQAWDTLAAFVSEHDALVAAGDVDGLRSLESRITDFLAVLPTTGADGLELPGATTIAHQAWQLREMIAVDVEEIAYAQNPDETFSRRRARSHKEDELIVDDTGEPAASSVLEQIAEIEAAVTAIMAGDLGENAATELADLSAEAAAIAPQTDDEIAAVEALSAYIAECIAALEPDTAEVPAEALSRRRRRAA